MSIRNLFNSISAKSSEAEVLRKEAEAKAKEAEALRKEAEELGLLQEWEWQTAQQQRVEVASDLCLRKKEMLNKMQLKQEAVLQLTENLDNLKALPAQLVEQEATVNKGRNDLDELLNQLGL